MKKILLAFMFVLFSQLHALDASSAIPLDHRALLDKVLADLHFEDADSKSRMTVYKELKPFLKDGWYAHWISNRTGSDSRMENAPGMFTDIMLYNNERITNVTFIYFRKFNQMFVSAKEFVATGDKLALERFNKNKTDSKLEMLNETDNYALFNEKGYMGYETVYIKGANAMMVYETSNYLDVYAKGGTNTGGLGSKNKDATKTGTPTLDKNPPALKPKDDNKEEDLILIPKS